jgi:hypothetical protein
MLNPVPDPRLSSHRHPSRSAGPVSATGLSRSELRNALRAIAAAAFSTPAGKLHSRRRGSAAVVLARQSAMYLAHVVFSLSYSEIGRIFNRERTTVRHACRCVEQRREDPATDAIFQELENACAALHHDDFGSKIMNVIDFRKLEHDVVRPCFARRSELREGGKPRRAFRHHGRDFVALIRGSPPPAFAD